VSTYDFVAVNEAGLESGCSGFPFPIDIDTPANTDRYPIILPKGRRDVTPVTDPSLARIVGRTRRVTIASNAVVSNGTESFNFPAGELPDFLNRLDETEIVLGNYGAQVHAESATVGNLIYQIEVQFCAFAPKVWLDGTDHRPFVDIYGSMTTSDGAGNDAFLEVASRESRLSGGIADGSFTGSIDGVNLTFYYLILTGGTGSASISTFAVNFTTFWGWDGKYNTATGGYA
jgi:hypothetical protein